MTASAQAEAAAAEEPSVESVVGKIVSTLSRETFGTGPLAELRRLDPNGPLAAPALYRVLAQCVPETWVRGESTRRWALVVHCLALAAPDRLGSAVGLGRALLDASFSDKRFVNLLDASPEELRDRLPRAVRFLVQRGGSLHGKQLADLALTDPAAPDYDARRQKIANDYYRAEYEAEKAKETKNAKAAG